MPRNIKLLALAMTMIPMAAVAQDAPRLSTIIAMLEDEGYVITDVEVERSVIEVDARTADGKEWDIHIDPATGAILETREDR